MQAKATVKDTKMSPFDYTPRFWSMRGGLLLQILFNFRVHVCVHVCVLSYVFAIKSVCTKIISHFSFHTGLDIDELTNYFFYDYSMSPLFVQVRCMCVCLCVYVCVYILWKKEEKNAKIEEKWNEKLSEKEQKKKEEKLNK